MEEEERATTTRSTVKYESSLVSLKVVELLCRESLTGEYYLSYLSSSRRGEV